VDQFKKNVALQTQFGLKVEWLEPCASRKAVPSISLDGLMSATYYDKDGHLNPFHTTQAYAMACKRKGVDIELFTQLVGIKTEHDAIKAAITNKGVIECEYIVNAAGGWSQIIGNMAGVSIPTYSERHQILITEPIEPLFRPMVMSFYHNFYTQQEPNGAIIMGIGDPNEPKEINYGNTYRFLHKMASVVTAVLPPLKQARVVRQWAGMYNMSPDKTPIIGKSPIKGFFIACGFSGHGFMIAPMTSTLVAQMMTNEPLSIPEVETKLDLGRFERGELFVEPSVV